MALKEISTKTFYGSKKAYIVPSSIDSSESDDNDIESVENVKILAYDSDEEEQQIGSSFNIVIDESELEVSSEEEMGSAQALLQQNKKKGQRKMFKKTYNWIKKDISSNISIEDALHDSLVTEIRSPLEYFLDFMSFDVISLIAEQTNLYSVQKSAKNICTTNAEITDLLAIYLYMGVIKLPSIYDYWSTEYRISQVANIMPLNRFKILRKYLHFCDNNQLDPKDRFCKIRPVFDLIRNNCLKKEIDTQFSIDETMIPYKGTRAGNLRQYIKSKPHKWGFKCFIRAGISGKIYDMILYQGASTFDLLDGTSVELSKEERNLGVGGATVVALSKTISQVENRSVYFDNFFCSVELLTYLYYKMQIRGLGTIRSNRIRKCPLMSDKNLSKKGRGSFDYKSDDNVIIVKWVDNKCVTIGSTLCGIQPVTTCKRYCKNAKKKIDIPSPAVINQYNKHMGGVDKSNALVGLYRTPYKSKKYYHAIFTYLIDICVVNAWIVYKYECNILGQTQIMPLKRFRSEIACALSNFCKIGIKRNLSTETLPRSPKRTKPNNLAQKDGFWHWPVHTTKGRCKNCCKGTSRIKCEKCNARLCLNENRNCFNEYHTK